MAAAIPYIVTIAGAALQAKAQHDQGKAQEEIANQNAAALEKDAKAAKQKAEYDEAAHRERVRRAIKSARVDIARSGVDSPTHLLALQESAAEGEMDALAIRHGGTISAERFKSGARIQRMTGAAARRAGRTGAGASLLAGAGRVAGR